MDQALPEHSPLGASSAERWIACPGSVTLIRMLGESGGLPVDDPDYRRDGTQAHALAAHCLNHHLDAWEADAAEFPALTAEMMNAVQVYLDYVRGLKGSDVFIEHKMHRPEFHALAYGTGDYISVSRLTDYLEFVDYKHGAGVAVEVRYNLQLMYYVYLFIGDDEGEFPDETEIKVTIVQPRIDWHPDGVIRSGVVDAGEVRRWAHNELRPAMERATSEVWFDMGEHCRFCPAKLVCPAMTNLAAKGLASPEAITFAEAEQLKMLITAVKARTLVLLSTGATLPDAKLVYARADRVWKPEAPLLSTFHEAAYKPIEKKSPAQIEKETGGKAFVAEWAYKPQTRLTVALMSDKRTAVKVTTDDEILAGMLKAAADG